jgi:hypothetical protein
MGGSIELKQLAQSGATDGQVVTYSSSSGKWIPATSGGGGSARPALEFSKSLNPSSQQYNGTVILGTYSPASTYQSISPAWWTLPPAVTSGGAQKVTPGLRLYWSDSSTSDYTNTSTVGALTMNRSQVYFNKDGLRITSIAFFATATGGSVTADLGAFTFEGNQT